MTTVMPEVLADSKVCSFMDLENRKWDEKILVDICNERDRNLIRRIPLSNSQENDEWMWLPEDKGCFTVRSCYRLLQGEIEAPLAQFWRKLWNLQLPGKIIYFLWRVCSLCLPTASRLAMKHV